MIAAVLLAPFVADWAAPSAGCRAAFDVLWASCGGETPPSQGLDFSLWGWIVRLVGWNVEALGVVSFAGAVVCAGLVGQIVGDVIGLAIARGREHGIELEGRREFAWLRNAAVVIGTLAFALTPAFLRAATRMGPLMVWMAQPLMVVALGGWFMTQGRSEPIRILRRWWWAVLLALLVFAHSAYEAYLIRRAIYEAWTGFVTFAAVGVAPCLVLAGLVRFRLLFIVRRRVQCAAFGAWALAVAVTGAMAFLSAGQGRAVSRLVDEIVAGAEGKRAIVCNGELEPLFAFALGGTETSPRLISLAHEYDPAYGRRLAAWVRGFGTQLPSANANLAKTDVATTARNTAPTPQSVFAKVDAPTNDATLAFSDSGVGAAEKTNIPSRAAFGCVGLAASARVVAGSENAKIAYRVSDLRSNIEDLAFAAELGAFALIDEWAKTDPTNFEAQVTSFASYFPTAERWREAVAAWAEAADDPFGDALRRFLGAAGNALGCRLLEHSAEREAWEVFREITEKVDRENYTALLNRLGMIERGYKVTKDEADEVRRRCGELAKRLGTRERILLAATSGGRLYVDPETAVRQEQERVARLRDRRLTPREEELVAAATRPLESAAECRDAHSTLTTAVRDGLVRVDHVGHQLINLDFALGDWGLAERDAISILRVDRHHSAANAAMGTINGVRGDYERAEGYFRRARSGEGQSCAVLNDLAFTLARTGRAKEAVPLAREAVAGRPKNWNFRETLAYALIRAGETNEGEDELAKAEAGAEASGRRKDGIVRFALDRAWLYWMKGDQIRWKQSTYALGLRMDLTDSQRRELEEVEGK